MTQVGYNKLELLVTNQWNNRIVGNIKGPENGRVLANSAIFEGFQAQKVGIAGVGAAEICAMSQ